MSKTTALIIVSCLIAFIILRLNIVFNYQDRPVTTPDYSPDLPVSYTGMLPCASCPGIEYELRLEEGQYTEFSLYKDREPGQFSTTGKWLISGDTLRISPDNPEHLKLFRISDNRLRLLDMNGADIAGNIADNYVIERNTEFQSILNRHLELRREGVTFVANGNEPSWSFTVHNSHTLTYTKLDEEIISRRVIIDRHDSGAELEVEFSSDRSLTASIEKQFCRDTMSGFIFTHKVEITDNEVRYQGCGRYL